MITGGAAYARPRFSWGKGFAHALIPALLLLGLGLLAAAFGWFPMPEAAGVVAGALSVPLFAAAFLTSYLLQTERSGCGFTALAFTVLGGLVAVVGLAGGTLLARLHPAYFTAADREFPELEWTPDGQRYHHTGFGFSLPAPPGRFVESPEIEEQLRKGAGPFGGWAWAYEDTVSHERILLHVVKGGGDDRDDFNDFTEGFKRSMTEGDGVELKVNELRWAEDGGDYLLQSIVNGFVHIDSRCLASGPREPTYIVCVTTVAREPSWSRRFLLGLQREPTAGG